VQRAPVTNRTANTRTPHKIPINPKEFLMKNTLKMAGLIALTAVISLTLSCKQEEDDGTSLLSLINIREAPDFPRGEGITSPSPEDPLPHALMEILEGQLLSQALAAAVQPAYENAFNREYSDSFRWWDKNRDNRSYKVSLKDIYGAGPAVRAGDDDPSNAVTIKGKASNEKTLKGITLSDYFTRKYNELFDLAREGATETNKSSYNLTFTFPLIEVKQYYSGSDVYLVGGVLKIEGKNNNTQTLKNKTDPQYTGYYANKGSSESKYSFALTVIDLKAKRGAKFRMSYATNGSGNQRKVSNEDSWAVSDMEIYDGNNTLIHKYTTGRNFTFASNLAGQLSIESLLRRLISQL
jgi:hypothetical protein